MGMMVNGDLDIREHLAKVNRRAGFLCQKLYGIRKLDDLRLNSNLFEVFIMPQYRLAVSLHSNLPLGTKRKL